MDIEEESETSWGKLHNFHASSDIIKVIKL
jgi:hypothetical protein